MCSVKKKTNNNKTENLPLLVPTGFSQVPNAHLLVNVEGSWENWQAVCYILLTTSFASVMSKAEKRSRVVPGSKHVGRRFKLPEKELTHE